MTTKLAILLTVTVINLTILCVVAAIAISGGFDASADASGDAANASADTARGNGGDVKLVSSAEGATGAGGAGATGARPADKDPVQAHIVPFLNQYCTGCHGPKQAKADLTLHQYTDKLAMQKGRKMWLTAIKMVSHGEMPAGKGPKPTADERKAFTELAAKVLDDVDCSQRDPGRVTIRRLNRAEYNNTVRDLLGVRFEPAADFPADDVGYGFDNIGDVLSMPPVLLEKYLKAAEQVATAALASDPGRAGSTVRYLEPKDLKGGIEDQRVRMMNDNGDIYVDLDLPGDGRYEFRIRAYGHQAGDELVKMGLAVDGQVIHTFTVKAVEKSEDHNHTATLKQGRRRIAARFLNDYYNPNDPNPAKRDRNLLVRSITVIGPMSDRPAVVSPSQIFTRLPKSDGSDWRQAATEILARKARQAYRRPVTQAEVDSLVRFVEMVRTDGGTFDQGVGLALQAMLVSPHFLFRVEQEPDAAAPHGIRTLNDHELATRLSYFLWTTMPDEELAAAADKGDLHKPQVLEAQVRRMLRDPKVSALVANFAGQWLQLRSLDRVQPDKKAFPQFDDELKKAMLRETELFFEAVIKEDRSVLDFIDGRFTFVNPRLARHYGIAGANGAANEFKRIDLDGSQRSGIITHASVLTVTSNPTRTSPVLRGKYVLEEFLADPPPPAPGDVPPLEEKGELKGTLRQRFEQHRANPVCASCHARMDPIGFGLENYDGIGQWRDKDNGDPVDPAGVLPDGKSFKTPAQLKAILLSHKDQFARCLAEKMLTYALGRGLEYYDKCVLDDITSDLARSDYRFSSLVMSIVTSEAFQKRRAKRADE